MTGLSTCPICRSDLERFAASSDQSSGRCPDCGADLQQFFELKANAEHYRDLAADLLARGDTGRAGLILDSLSRIVGSDELPLSVLKCRLALEQGRFDDATALLDQVGENERNLLQPLIKTGMENRRLALEQYNYALTSARDGKYKLAQTHIDQAAGLMPQDAHIWVLKLKIDLKARDFAACYRDLDELDHLGGRPGEYSRLESILPPL